VPLGMRRRNIAAILSPGAAECPVCSAAGPEHLSEVLRGPRSTDRNTNPASSRRPAIVRELGAGAFATAPRSVTGPPQPGPARPVTRIRSTGRESPGAATERLRAGRSRSVAGMRPQNDFVPEDRVLWPEFGHGSHFVPDDRVLWPLGAHLGPPTPVLACRRSTADGRRNPPLPSMPRRAAPIGRIRTTLCPCTSSSTRPCSTLRPATPRSWSFALWRRGPPRRSCASRTSSSTARGPRWRRFARRGRWRAPTPRASCRSCTARSSTGCSPVMTPCSTATPRSRAARAARARGVRRPTSRAPRRPTHTSRLAGCGLDGNGRPELAIGAPGALDDRGFVYVQLYVPPGRLVARRCLRPPLPWPRPRPDRLDPRRRRRRRRGRPGRPAGQRAVRRRGRRERRRRLHRDGRLVVQRVDYVPWYVAYDEGSEIAYVGANVDDALAELR